MSPLSISSSAPRIVAVGPLVRAGDDDHLVASVAVVALLQGLEKLPAVEVPDVRKVRPEARHGVDAPFEHAAYQRGVEEDARLGLLTDHLVHRPVDHLAVAGHEDRIERRTVLGPHGRELGVVAHPHQPAPLAAADVGHQIVQQGPGAEKGSARRVVGEHRGLVDDEQRVLLAVGPQGELRFVGGVGSLQVDPLVDGQRPLVRVAGQHLGRPSRRCQKNGFDIQILKRRHKGRNERRLARPGESVENENLRGIVIGKILREFFYDFFLAKSCFETNFSVNLGRNTCAKHFFAGLAVFHGKDRKERT